MTSSKKTSRPFGNILVGGKRKRSLPQKQKLVGLKGKLSQVCCVRAERKIGRRETNSIIYLGVYKQGEPAKGREWREGRLKRKRGMGVE